ncbi:MAG: dienelactone hydrolase family protein [Archaeoglobaceae archaeon]|nr:dienelactone hydrolase family protein [Archaeoglobaceae archaeon]MCX8151752.1 dienelactone hydrolase family protein [Archaeoglobaceae archaeon]MDW8014278.1 dienelactone hydrolase family protein [Archaeoglobaceae archaeon]
MEVLVESIKCDYEVKGQKVVLLCPPHPLFGGSMFDVRVERIARELLKRGLSVMRFDYRKPYRKGVGEVEDAKKVVQYLKLRHESISVVGYSFGSLVASNVASLCEKAVYISPLQEIDEVKFLDVKIPKLFIFATKDQIVPISVSLEIYERSSEPKKILMLETDHFYFGKFQELARAVVEFLC